MDPLLTPEDAWNRLVDLIEPLPGVAVPLGEAVGAWLAEPLTADRDIPPAPRAAMDGFAFRHADIDAAPVRLDVVGEVAAGSPADPPLAAGTCVRIFTGANLPSDADTVVPVEATSVGRFGPGEPGATVGRSAVLVHRKPGVAVLNTGAELLEAGLPADRHQTRNSNGPFLGAAVRATGLPVALFRTVPDCPARTVDCLKEALSAADAVIVTGGISAGRHDYVPAAVAAAGAEIVCRGVAIKPGKPQLFARAANGALIFGLPGNPLSCLVGFYEFVLPVLRRMSGCPPAMCRPEWILPLAQEVEHAGDRTLVLPCTLLRDADGTRVQPRRPVGSADLVTGGLVDGALLLPPRCGRIDAGTLVRFRRWSEDRT